MRKPSRHIDLALAVALLSSITPPALSRPADAHRSGRTESVSDFFPLGVGRIWPYNYIADEKDYYNIAFVIQHNVDTGTVSFQVLSVSSTDTSFDWTVKETDIVTRHAVGDEYGSKDTVFPVGGTTRFLIHESLDSAHTLVCTSNFPAWQFLQSGPGSDSPRGSRFSGMPPTRPHGPEEI